MTDQDRLALADEIECSGGLALSEYNAFKGHHEIPLPDDKVRLIVAALRAQSGGEPVALIKFPELAREFDEIETDDDGLCKWTDVAAALCHLRGRLYATPIAGEPGAWREALEITDEHLAIAGLNKDWNAAMKQVGVLRAALEALERQALQSDVNDPSNEWGREALAMARAALASAPQPTAGNNR